MPPKYKPVIKLNLYDTVRKKTTENLDLLVMFVNRLTKSYLNYRKIYYLRFSDMRLFLFYFSLVQTCSVFN